MSFALTAVDLEATTKAIRGLADYFGAELDRGELRVYVDGLRDIPIEHLKAGCRQSVRARKFFPKVAEIRQDVDSALSAERVTQQLASQVHGDEDWHGRTYNCSACHDSGWVFLGERQNGRANDVERCHCFRINPALVQRKPYGGS